MLRELYRHLTALLEEAGFTAFAEDAVAPDARFPFVAMRIEAPMSMHETGSIILTSWHRGSAPHAERLHAADALAALFPAGGRLVRLESGLAVASPAGCASFPESHGALGVCIRLNLRVCADMKGKGG